MLLKKTLLLKNKFENKINTSIDSLKKEIAESIKQDVYSEIKELKEEINSLKSLHQENNILKEKIEKTHKIQQVCSQDISTLASAINELYKVYEMLLVKHFEDLKEDKDDIYH